MKGVSFNNIHSYRDLNLILAPFEIPPAPLKENYIDVPGGNGGIDLTEAFGEVKYDYREFDLNFSVLPSDDWEVKKRQITNLLHGSIQTLVFDRNPNYSLTGRLTVSDYKSNKLNRQIVIRCKMEPYWTRTAESVYSCTLGSSKNLVPRINDWRINNDAQIFNDTAFIEAYGAINHTFTLSGSEDSISISAESDESSVRCYRVFYNASNQAITGGTATFNINNGKCENIAVPNSATKMMLKIYPTKRTVISKIQVEQGSVCTAYEPKDGVLIQNDNLLIIPEIEVSAAMTIYDRDKNNYSLSAGSHKILDIIVPTGESIITASGSGTLTVRFTERAL